MVKDIIFVISLFKNLLKFVFVWAKIVVVVRVHLTMPSAALAGLFCGDVGGL